MFGVAIFRRRHTPQDQPAPLTREDISWQKEPTHNHHTGTLGKWSIELSPSSEFRYGFLALHPTRATPKVLARVYHASRREGGQEPNYTLTFDNTAQAVDHFLLHLNTIRVNTHLRAQAEQQAAGQIENQIERMTQATARAHGSAGAGQAP